MKRQWRGLSFERRLSDGRLSPGVRAEAIDWARSASLRSEATEADQQRRGTCSHHHLIITSSPPHHHLIITLPHPGYARESVDSTTTVQMLVQHLHQSQP